MKSQRYQYDKDRSPEENVASALYPIANELSKIGVKDPGEALGALEALAIEVKEGEQAIADAVETMSLQKREGA